MSPFMTCLGYQPPLFDFQQDEEVGPYVEANQRRCRSHARLRGRTPTPSYWQGQRVWLSSMDLLQMNFRQRTLSDTSWMSVGWFLVELGGGISWEDVRRRRLRGGYCHNCVLGDVQITTACLSHTCTSCFMHPNKSF